MVSFAAFFGNYERESYGPVNQGAVELEFAI